MFVHHTFPTLYKPRILSICQNRRDALGSLNPLGLVGGGGSGAAMATAEAAQSSWTGGVRIRSCVSLLLLH